MGKDKKAAAPSVDPQPTGKRLQVTFMVNPDELPMDTLALLDLDHPMGVTDAAFENTEETFRLMAEYAEDIDFESVG